jgi:D-alanine-D-alanine ligase
VLTSFGFFRKKVRLMKINPDWWKSLFDRVYLMTDARSVCDDRLTCREVDMLETYLDLDKSGAILDLCGGHGRHALELCRRGYCDVTVVDFSDFLLDEGRRKAKSEDLQIHFVKADARNTGLPGDRFRVAVVMANSFGYFHDARDDRAFLNEAHRMLATGGTLLLDLINTEALVGGFKPFAWHEIGEDIVVCRHRVLNEDNVLTREMVLSKSTGLVRDETYFVRLYSPATITDLLTASGFGPVTVYKDFAVHNKAGDFGFLDNRMIVIAHKPS